MQTPTGIIAIWFGAIIDIPAGWILCDGGGGSPDLRDRFIVGAGSTYAVNDTGGAVNHNHDFTGDGHSHVIPAGSVLNIGPPFSDITSTAAAIGTTDNESSLPPYLALAYIMKT